VRPWGPQGQVAISLVAQAETHDPLGQSLAPIDPKTEIDLVVRDVHPYQDRMFELDAEARP
jgi:hypothetical protein